MPEEAWINSRGVKEHAAAFDIHASVHEPSRHCRGAVSIGGSTYNAEVP